MMYKMMMKGGLRFFIFCIVGNLFFVIEGSILNVTIWFVIFADSLSNPFNIYESGCFLKCFFV